MENNDHNDSRPTNKWVATPIVAAFIFIGIVVFFISQAAGNSNCKNNKTNEHGTEQHDATDKDEHGGVKTNETTDSTNAPKDSTLAGGDSVKVVNEANNHGH